MGKNRDLDSLIRLIVNTAVHELVLNHTNKAESKNFLNSEIIEYRSQVKEAAKSHNWNYEDKIKIEDESIKLVKQRIAKKYPDVSYNEDELIEILKKIIGEVI